jgi:competence ComEA-like helix-hairpin-helix protein
VLQHFEFVRRAIDAIRTLALKFFTPKEFRAVMLFLFAGFAVLCYRGGKRMVYHFFPKLADSTEIVTTHRNDSLFALLSRKDFVRDSLNFYIPEDTLARARADKSSPVPSKKSALLAPRCICLNTSGEDSLMLLPGIGKSMAERIVGYRSTRGKFRRLEELMNIQGLGEKKFDRIAPFLRLN